MADITKCTNRACPIKHDCYRWTAPADPLWQSYANFRPKHDGTCEHMIPVHHNHPVTDGETPSKSRELE